MAEKRPWHWVDVSLFVLYTFWHALGYVYLLLDPESIGDPPLILFSTVLFINYALPLLFWRPGYVHLPGFAVSVLLTSGVTEFYLAYHYGVATAYLALPAIVVAFLSKGRHYMWTAPLFVLSTPLVYFFIVEDVSFANMFDSVLVFALMYGFGLSVNRILNSNFKMKQLLRENEDQYALIQEQNRVLEQYTKEVEHITLLEERERMARELHDTIGHTFTSVIMGMDAAQYLIDTNPEKAKEQLERLSSVTRKSLEEIRRNIHQIAPADEHLTMSQQLSRLASEFALHTGTKVDFKVKGEEVEFSKQAKLTFIRCLQESLTNAKRHGQALNVEVRLTYTKDWATMCVEDDGIGSDHLTFGFGIRAMKERLTALNGDLFIDTAPGNGTKLHIGIPLRQEAAAFNKAIRSDLA